MGRSDSESEDEDDFFDQRRSSSHNGARSGSSHRASSGAQRVVSSDSEDTSRGGKANKGKGKGVRAPRPLERGTRQASVTLSSSPERETQGATFTQLDRSSEALRNMAAQKGWVGPPPKVLAVKQSPKVVPVVAGSSKGKAPPSSDTTSTATKSTRPLPKAKKATPPSPARQMSLSPDFLPPPPPMQLQRQQPPSPVLVVPAAPPVSFWNAGEPAAGPSKAKKRVHGVASRELETLSEQGRKVMERFILSEEESIEDEDSGGEKQRPKYESFAAKAKRKREEDLANLKKSRIDKQIPVFTTPSTSKGKGKDQLASCPICFQDVYSSELAQHANNCADLQTTAEKKKAPAPKTAFRPASIAKPPPAAAAPIARRAPPAAVVEKQRTPPPEPRVDNANLLADLDFSPPPARRIDAASKGKARAIIVQEPESQEEEDEIEMEEMDDDEWEKFDDFARGQRGQTVDVRDMDVGGRRGGGDTDSSPPRGSIFISTLPRAVRDGYEHMYKVNVQKGDIDAPQKMTDAPPKKTWGGARGRGRGGGVARRGARGGARRGKKK